MKKAVIYARVSSINDRQSTDRQVADLRKYAKYKEFQLEQIYEEKISGAKKNEERHILIECLDFCKNNNIDILLISELSRLGRNAFEVLEMVKLFIDNRINIYFQKEQFLLLDEEGQPSLFAPIMLATLATCAQLERENIKFRLNSGRKQYIENGGRLGRKVGSIKSIEKKKEEYKEAISLLRKGISVRNVAKLTGKGTATIQRIKTEFGL